MPSSTTPRSGSADSTQIPTTRRPREDLEHGLALADLLVSTELAESKSAARRLISQGAVRLNDVRQVDPAYTVMPKDAEQNVMLLRAGKKAIHRLVFT